MIDPCKLEHSSKICDWTEGEMFSASESSEDKVDALSELFDELDWDQFQLFDEKVRFCKLNVDEAEF